MYGKFWFDGDFFVRNLDASVELRQYQSLSQRNLFLFLTGFFILFLFFNQGLSSALDFSISTELPCVNFVKCAMQAKCGNKMKIESRRKRLPRKFPQGIRPGPRL